MGSSPQLVVVVGVRVNWATLAVQQVVGTQTVSFQGCPGHGPVATSFCGICGRATEVQQREEPVLSSMRDVIEKAARALGLKGKYGDSAVIHETSQESSEYIVGLEMPTARGKSGNERTCLLTTEGLGADDLALVRQVVAPLNSPQPLAIHIIASVNY